MNLAQRKLQSRRGASITFALLIFLVCAVVSSIVIVAGTAAAGRMSNLAQMDQRYYAVTSAAGLLRDKLCGEKKVNVTYDKVNKMYSAAIVNGGAEEYGLIEDTSMLVVKAMREKRDFIRSFSLKPNSAIANAKLDCRIVETVNPNGIAVFDVSSSDGTANIYTLKIKFASNTKQNAALSTDNTEVVTVEWRLNDVSKVEAKATIAPGTGG